MNRELVYVSVDAEQALRMLDELVDLYNHVYGKPSDDFHGEARYRRQITGHMAAPGWQAIICTHREQLVGYAYGFPLPPTTRWWQGLTTTVAADFAVEDGHRTFAISEIMVSPDWWRRGIAGQLHAKLVADRSESRATLLVEPDNEAAYGAYRAWGWTKVAELKPSWDDSPTYDVMVLPLT